MTIDPSAVRAALLRHHRALAGIVDQAIVGAGNLAIGLMILRTSTKEEYGLYSLSYMTLILLNGFSNALFVAQLTVSYHERPADHRTSFAAALLCGQMLIGLSLAATGLAVASLLPADILPPELRRLVVAAALACPAVMAHDFLRGYFFLVERPMRAIALDLILILGWCAGTVWLIRGAGLAPPQAALMAFGAAALASTGTGLVLSGLPLRSGWGAAARTVASVWGHGRWALSGSAVTALQNQGHVYLLGWLGSAEAIAELNAARMLMMPMGLLILGVGRTLTPTLARQAAEGQLDALRRHARRTLLGVLSVIGLYSAAMLLGEHHLIAWVLGQRYEGIAPLLALWMAILMLQAIDLNLSAIMQVAKRFRELMLINAWMVVPVLAGAVAAIPRYGAEGNLVVVVAGYIGVVLLLRREVRRAMAGMERGARADRTDAVPADRPRGVVREEGR